MFKKSYGIAIYPEKTSYSQIKDYLTIAKQIGFTQLFMSWPKTADEKTIKLYHKIIKFADNLNFYIILDICDDNFAFYQTLGVDCLRLDTPMLANKIAEASYFSDIQLNISVNNSLINHVLEYQPVKENIYGCHNFYPLLQSGLSLEFFKESTARFNDLGIETSAFINSQIATSGPQKFPLTNGATTVEVLRNKPIHSQVKYLWATKQIDSIIIANQFANMQELQQVINVDPRIVEFDLICRKELSDLEMQIIDFNNHFVRGDINENFIRSTQTRVVFASESLVESEEESSDIFNKGDVLIFNKNEPNYQNELIIVQKTIIIPKNKVKHVGTIAKYDEDLLDLIKPWQCFKFKRME